MAIMRKRWWTRKLCAAAILLMLGIRCASAYDWLQFGGDPQHSGRNTAETILSPANVGTLAVKYQVPLAGLVDGAPVFLENVSTPGGIKDLLFVTTRDGQIIALDAQNGAVVWSQQYGPGTCTINNGGGSACYTTSSPAIDPDRLHVYGYGLDGYVHKYQVGDGVEILTGGWSQLTTLKGYDEKGSSALSIATVAGVKYLYVAHAGYPGDNGDYQGHITAINLATGAQKVFNTACSHKARHLDHFVAPPETTTTCAARQNAIWARPGVFYDAGTNRIFMATGNAFTAGVGRFDGVHNWSESVIALQPDGAGGTAGNLGKPLDSYTPPNWSSLDDGDTDIGSTGPTILPAPANSNVQHLAVQSGKDGMLRLLNLADLSGAGGPGNLGGSIGAPISVRQGGGVFSQPAVWINPADNSTWFFVVNGNGTSAVRVNVDGGGNPSLVTQWPSIDMATSVPGGTSPVVANNMLFYLSAGGVRVVDPVSGSILLTALGTGSSHWQSLIVANGVVYVTDQSSNLTAFSLASSQPPTTTSLSSSANPANAGTSVVLTATVTGTGPTGNVDFSEGGNALAGCAAVALSGGGKLATCTISTLSVGSHAIVASYGGDAGNAASTSNTLLQVIDTASGGTNVALASAGAVALASSVFSAQFPVAALNNNERKGAGWGNGGGWNDATANAFPDWVEIDFNGSKTIDRVIVYTLQDNYPNPIEPTDTLTLRPVRGHRLQRAGLEWQCLDHAGHRRRQHSGQAGRDLRRLHHHAHPGQRDQRADAVLTPGRSRSLGQRRSRSAALEHGAGQFVESVAGRQLGHLHGHRHRDQSHRQRRLYRRRQRDQRLQRGGADRQRQCPHRSVHQQRLEPGHAQHRRRLCGGRRQRRLEQQSVIASGQCRRREQCRAGQQRRCRFRLEHHQRRLPGVGASTTTSAPA